MSLAGPGGGFRFGRKSGGSSSSAGVGSVNYPSPFFDLAGTYLPSTIKQLFKYCRYYMLTNPLISAVISKMALYPVTEVIYETPDNGLRAKWRDLLTKHFRIRSFLINANLDRECYGNAFISLFFPFQKYLKCTSCGKQEEVGKSAYKFRSYKYWLSCGKCLHHGPAKVTDKPIRSARGIRLIRWDPESINVDYNPVTQVTQYYYKIPAGLKNSLTMGKKNVVETIPHSFVRALEANKALLLAPDNLYHYKRSSISHTDQGWGIPRLLPVLKDAYFLQILKKSQEMVAQEHIVPLRVLFPQPGSATSDPYQSIQLNDWMKQVKSQIDRWKTDQNYMPIFPLPIGNQTIGGDAKALMLHDEIRVWSEQIIAGMGVPQEFVMGGLSYSGSSVSLRMLENEFMGHREDMLGLVEFLISKVSMFMDWVPVGVRLAPFKMADDLQRAAFDMQMNMAGKISDSSLLSSRDYDYEEEKKLMDGEAGYKSRVQKKQQTDQATSAGEAMLVQARYQAKAAEKQQAAMAAQQQAMPGQEQQQQGAEGAAPAEGQAPPEEGMGQQPPPQMGAVQSPISTETVTPGMAGMDIRQMAEQAAKYLRQLDPQAQQQELGRLRAEQPDIFRLVFALLNQETPGDNGSAGRPLPSQKPPRRGPETALI